MKVGDLVITNSGTKHNGAIGVVIAVEPDIGIARCLGLREEELLVTVSYPETGARLSWSEHSLEVVS